MNILLISKFFPPQYSARALQIGKVYSAIKNKGCSVKVISGTINKENLKNKHFSNDVYYVNYKKNSNKNNLLLKFFDSLLSKLSEVNYKDHWVKNAEKLIKITSNELKPDLILTSSTPFQSHLVGLNVAREMSIPWVVSFSDPWPPYFDPIPHREVEIPILNKFQIFTLRRVLNRCDAVHMTNRYSLKLMETKSGVKIHNKSYIIPHIGTGTKIKKTKLVKGWLTHIGFLSRQRVSIQLLEAVRDLVNDSSNQFKGLICVGAVCDEFRTLIKKMNLVDNVKIVKRVSHEDAVKISYNSEALLVLEADMQESPYLPSKFADYSIVKRPIIAVTPKRSSIRDYINKYGGGYAVSNNRKEISEAINKVFSKRSTFLNLNSGLSSIFESENVAKEYISMFHSVLFKN